MNEPLVLADLVGLEEELVAHVARELPHALFLVLATFDVDCESRAHLVPSEKCLRLKKLIHYKIFTFKINQPKISQIYIPFATGFADKWFFTSMVSHVTG